MDEQTELWLVQQYPEGSNVPEFQGVFSSEERAVAACRTDRYFVCGPITLDEEVPHESLEWNTAWGRAYYSLKKGRA